jgi:two-component system sensor histidine kinase BarA
MFRRHSLARKTVLWFALVVALVLLSAMVFAWNRLQVVLDEGEAAVSRQMVAVWEAAARRAGGLPPSGPGDAQPPGTGIGEALADGAGGAPGPEPPTPNAPTMAAKVGGLQAGVSLFVQDAKLEVLSLAQVEQLPERSPFLADALARMRSPDVQEVFDAAWDFTSREYRYAKALRGADGTLEGLITLKRASPEAWKAALRNAWMLMAAWGVCVLAALGLLYAVLARLILRPLEALRETADAAREGDLRVRSEVTSGDEFEDMASALNAMLTNIQIQQDQLRAINASLDVKVTELAERNVALYESARLKGEFLASVTHELRTPLNSILGFAELLDEQAEREAAALAGTPEEQTRMAKRRRYIDNILNAGRALLELINSLLEMAKVEAGKMDLTLGEMRVRPVCEQLLALMRPAADKRQVELRLTCPDDLPPIYTDQRKFQQIIFNFLSNAVKFSADAADTEREALRAYEAQVELSSHEDPGEPDPGEGGDRGIGRAVTALPPRPRTPRQPLVELRVEQLVVRAGEGHDAEPRIRVSVLDNGPGIAKEDQARIFEKFTQLDTGYQRRHAGTGLGLAICRTLTEVLGGEIQVHSEPGRGSMFSLILPMRYRAGSGSTAHPSAEPVRSGA